MMMMYSLKYVTIFLQQDILHYKEQNGQNTEFYQCDSLYLDTHKTTVLSSMHS